MFAGPESNVGLTPPHVIPSEYGQRQIGDAIKRNRINTAVVARCISACVDIFIAGKQREIAPNAALALHSTKNKAAGLAIDRPYWKRMGFSRVNERAYKVPHDKLWVLDAKEAIRLRLATGIL